MRKRTGAAVSIGTAGVGTYLLYQASQGRISTDPNAEGYPIEGGSLVITPEMAEEETREGYILGPDGGEHQIGSYGAINASYDLAVYYTDLVTDCCNVALRAMSEDTRRAFIGSFLRRGTFDLSLLDDAQLGMVSALVNAGIQMGQSLRLLGYCCYVAGIHRMYRPQKWINRGVDLANIRHGCVLNPMVNRYGDDPDSWDYRYTTITRPVQWLAAGWQIITSWGTAYLPNSEINRDTNVIEAMREELAFAAEASATPMQGTMGALTYEPTMGLEPATTAALISGAVAVLKVVVIASAVVGAIYVIAEAGPEYAALILNRNLEYQRAQVRAYESAIECATDMSLSDAQREECNQLAARLATETERYASGWDTTTKIIAAGAVLGGGYLLYRVLT